MSWYRFLLDEHLPRAICAGLGRRNREIEVMMVGDEGAPPHGTPDSRIILWLERHDYCLVTGNRRTMPVYLGEHLACGRHVRGVFALRKGTSIGEAIQELYLIWAAATPGEFADKVVYIPFR
ncbi:MAG: DUF5615 family PIN-like protein [Armatimonadetes bacterium]|nr:DUF5615 family PIN-like protein [Armatimonadota bacterium]